MNTLKVERLFISAFRNVSSVAIRDASPARIVVNRLDAHLKRVSRIDRRNFSTNVVRHVQIQTQYEVNENDALSLPFADPLPTGSDPNLSESAAIAGLPTSCPGCGGLTQESEPGQAGFYSTSRRIVKRYIRQQRAITRATNAQAEEEHGNNEDEINEVVNDQEQDGHGKGPTSSASISTPFCDRCHDLIHNSRGQPIAHPTIDNIADSIAESPFKKNHIYHVVDAADFPMSLVPEIFNKLSLAKPRSQNRRSQHDFSSKPTLSFIITRSDLLGSTKEIVDGMMAYFQSVLRQALGRAGRDMRIGNIHLVSAKRGWWTKEIKEDIWKRGGANWMVGKVNVGKSNLFEVLFPKGSGDRAPVYAELRDQQSKETQQDVPKEVYRNVKEDTLLLEDSLLPPAQAEVPFPVMPIVSSLPGTTASPIRLPFGGHKGELIDLPGLDRGNLEDYVRNEHKTDLVMSHRHDIEQHTIKAGQSLILGGGLIRITPQLDPEDRSTIVLAYPFVPLKPHVTSTEKAIAQQLQKRESGVGSILEENAGAHMASAGMFNLDTDITKARAGPLLRAGVSVSKLPFQVFATDVLIEGMGWVELVCQVRRRRGPQLGSTLVAHDHEGTSSKDPHSSEALPTSESGFAPFARQPPLENVESAEISQFPKIEIFSPKGKHVSQRPCLQAWTRWTSTSKAKSGMTVPAIRRPAKGLKPRVKLGQGR